MATSLLIVSEPLFKTEAAFIMDVGHGSFVKNYLFILCMAMGCGTPEPAL